MRLFDLHNDFPTALCDSEWSRYLSSTGAGSVITGAIWTTDMQSASALDRVERITSALKSIDVPVSVEDLGFAEQNDAYLSIDYSQFFYCTLTWNYNNGFAGGALGDGMLTKKGKRLIGLINGMCALDLAHLNRCSFFMALDEAARPICSHTGFAKHPRSLDSEQIKALVNRGSIIGLSAVTAFTGADTASGLAQTIDSFVQHYGCNELCLGTDFNGTSDLPSDLKSYADIDNLCAALISKGYSHNDINKILYANAMRFYEEIKK